MRDLLELKDIALLYELWTFFRLADEITAVLEPGTREEAARKLAIPDTKTAIAVDRLRAMEDGDQPPTRAMLSRMAKQYHRPLVAFYLSQPPRRANSLHEDLGPDHFERHDKERRKRHLVNQLRKVGVELDIKDQAA